MADLTTARVQLDKLITRTETIVGNVETLWQFAPLQSDVRKQIGEAELSALYEMSFLTTFGYWENFIEDCVVRMIAGQGCGTYPTPVLAQGQAKAPTLTAARVRLLGNRPFLLWHSPTKCVTQLTSHVVGSPLEAVITANQTDLEYYAAVRHAVAHRSTQTADNFAAASVALTGVGHSTPGLLLRSLDHTDPMNPIRRIRQISNALRAIALAATS